MDEEKKKEEIALFRYGLISPVIHGNVGMQIKYLRKIAEKQSDCRTIQPEGLQRSGNGLSSESQWFRRCHRRNL